MSFLSKLKGGSTNSEQAKAAAPAKKDPNAPQPTPLEKHLKDASGPLRIDGSDKFFGFENYGSTCYCNSIIQCLYYSAPFRSQVLNFPPNAYLHDTSTSDANGAPISPRSTSATPWPNATSPARKPAPAPGSLAAQGKPEETKDSPEYRKRTALQVGPVLDMVHDYSNKYNMDESLFTAMKDIFDAIISNQSRIGIVSPHKFLEILRRENEMFRSAMHQDAHEFLNLLLNEVVENVEAFSKQHPSLSAPHANGGAPEEGVVMGVPKASSNGQVPSNGIDTHWVHDLFEGLLTSETRCLTCENMSQRDEPFLDLSVDLSAHTSVTSCLRKFSEEEMLCERNKFHCDNCGGLQEAEKRMKIKRLPRVLALHLKRFKYTEDLQRLQKLFHRVVYPFHLRLFNTTEDAEDPDRLYELYAVVVHIGGGPYHGHYVSIIKTQDRGWLLFDDELVEPVDKSYVLNFFGGEPIPGLQDAKQLACAYVLFYQETTLEAILKEQEMEGQEPTATRVSDVEVAKDASLSSTKNGLHTTQTLNIPIVAEPEGVENLAQVKTEPNITSPRQVLLEKVQPTTTVTPIISPKSRKERKAEEKEKKAAAKAEEKIKDEKRQLASTQRVEAWRKQDEDVKAATELSKQTAAEEAKLRGDEVPKEGGLARFRTGSKSLRRTSLFGSKDKEEASTEKLPALPQDVGENNVEEPDGPASAPAGDNEKTLSPPAAAEKTRRNRFSLGRKRSQAMA